LAGVILSPTLVTQDPAKDPLHFAQRKLREESWHS